VQNGHLSPTLGALFFADILATLYTATADSGEFGVPDGI
jgi:hypothetical protein